MCGITGFWSPLGVSREVEARFPHMVDTLRHRGPSGQKHKLFKNPTKTQSLAGLGTARLAIIGPENGDQPIASPSGRWHVSLNGEIYNHHTLRRESIALGSSPLNYSDTAVIASLLDVLSVDQVLQRLRGMFALAIYDATEHTIYLIRDRMGQKPLYWMQLEDGTVLWSSESRTLQEFASPEISDIAIGHLLCFEYIPAPMSIWKDMQKLLPAHMLQFSSTHTHGHVERYWNMPIATDSTKGSLVHWKKSLEYALHSAVRLQLQADVPVGTLLSGGIDSTTIAYLVSQIHPNSHAFSVNVAQKGFSEASAIQENAQFLGLPHTCFALNHTDFTRILDAVSLHMDEPVADSSLISTWFLFEQMAKTGMQCVLSGDGADELFGGYPTYALHRYPTLLPNIQERLSPFAHMLSWIPSSFAGVSWDFMLRRWMDSNHPSVNSWFERHQLWMGAWFPWEFHRETGIANTIWDRARSLLHTDHSHLTQAMHLDAHLYLAEGVLTKVDRSSMAHGIEVRSPFLDHQLVELIAEIPITMKLQRGQNKKILRELYPAIPSAIRHRKKQGFGSPVATWMTQYIAEEIHQLPKTLERWIDPTHTKQIIHEHLSGAKNHRRRLWSGVILQRWLANYGKNTRL